MKISFFSKWTAYLAAGSLLLAPLMASAAAGTGAYLTNAGTANLPTGSIYSIISQTMLWLLAILGFLAIIGFVISGILYLTAAGDDARIKLAKSAMWASIAGVIVALVGYVVVRAVNIWLGAGTQF